MTPITYQLYPASIDDCLEISKTFQHQAEITDWGGEGFVFPVRYQQFLLQLHRPDTTSYVLKQQETIVGFGQICQRFTKHHLARLLILPAFRGRGLSYILMVSMMRRAMQQNPKLDFSLYVFKHNNRAIHCYQKLGFQIAPQPGPEHPGLYFMQLNLELARLLLDSEKWQLQLNSEFVSCRFQEISNANLD